LFGPERILAFAVGKPSEAFGEPYRTFDEERVIARLPGPPYSFLDRIIAIDAAPWKMVAGGRIVAQYDVPADAWYLEAERQPCMPFAVLLEVALQGCGWLAAYVGSALTSPVDLSFRNLGGSAELFDVVRPDTGTLTTQVSLNRVASSGGMIIQDFTFAVSSVRGPVYRGTTTFGFFTKAALATQVGLRDAALYQPDAQARGGAFDFPRHAPFPDERLGMIDRVTVLLPQGGPNGLGFIEGKKRVRPEEWFFQAHFYQDPVWPGSLGVEAFLQLVKVLAAQEFPGEQNLLFEIVGRHQWTYRGQVIPANTEVTVQASITQRHREGSSCILKADGWLSVDGLTIYKMQDFAVKISGDSLTTEARTC
jgi:3-hydroxymyristoyl/3-hydroxydecanoyl-(acyl carrier protein) dehydratase